MKQNITIDQVNQLSEKGKERLRKRWKPCLYDLYYSSDYSDDPICFDNENQGIEYKNNALPLLSIGQMIEFLDQHRSTLHMSIYESVFDNDKIWVVTEIIHKKEAEELCDALWEAVKEILEK